MRIAFSTSEQYMLEEKHFGDGDLFVIYEITADGKIEKIEELVNKEKHDDAHYHDHGEQNKAQGIGQKLKKYDVKALVSKQYGANIVRMLKNFVVVKAHLDQLEAQIKHLAPHISFFEKEFEQNTARKMIKSENL